LLPILWENIILLPTHHSITFFLIFRDMKRSDPSIFNFYSSDIWNFVLSICNWCYKNVPLEEKILLKTYMNIRSLSAGIRETSTHMSIGTRSPFQKFHWDIDWNWTLIFKSDFRGHLKDHELIFYPQYKERYQI
jgi:hypothetical protein